MRSMSPRAIKCCLKGTREGMWRSCLTLAASNLIIPDIKPTKSKMKCWVEKKKRSDIKLDGQKPLAVVTLTWTSK